MKTQTQILDNRLHYTRKIELHRKGKKSRTARITPILICPPRQRNLSVLITVRRVRYGEMGKAPTTLILLSVYSQEISSTIFKVIGMTRPGIEPRSPRPLTKQVNIISSISKK